MDAKAWLRSNWESSLGAACLVAGIVATIAACLGVRSSRFLTEDLSYLISGGVGGLALIAVGTTLLITASLHGMRRDLLKVGEAVRSARLKPSGVPDRCATGYASPRDHSACLDRHHVPSAPLPAAYATKH